MKSNQPYQTFLESKIKLAEKAGFDIEPTAINPWHKPHVKDIVKWAVQGGRRAIFANFGMHKTAIQLEIVAQYLRKYGGNGIITCPLAVQYEFKEDAEKMGLIDRVKYITCSDEIDDNHDIYLTNYERIRVQDRFDPTMFTVTSGDEASVLRSLDSQTTEAFNKVFRQIPNRFVATATPAPNRFLEITHYADYLGIMDRGQILTRFFQRDSTTAGNLTLYEKREKEFWYWVNSWAVIITKPSDLGHSDEGYQLPQCKIRWHNVSFDRGVQVDKRSSQVKLVADISAGVGREKSDEDKKSIPARLEKVREIISQSQDDHFVIWHHREDERRELEKAIPGIKTVWGSQKEDQREDHLIGFKQGKHKILATKPSIAGQGCNFQYHCHRAVYMGIDDNFNDFIQSMHRIVRFGQKHTCEVDIIHTDAQQTMKRRLETKWRNHLEMQAEMTAIIRKHGLNSELYMKELKRETFTNRQEITGKNFRAVNNDSVQEMPGIESNSIGMILTSIPFGNHYEYSENYNCFGHNQTNEDFFAQMDFLTPELYRSLMPGRIAAIHVKDRIRYSYMNGTGFTSIEPFSDHVNAHFIKHGFVLIDRKTITTDVVAENAQTYRLGWTEKCKDGSKIGGGIPEYLLVFRKPPTDNSNAYADVPVVHSKEEYTRSRWQLDAHAYWKSNGHRLFDTELLKKLDLSEVLKAWQTIEVTEDYELSRHQKLCEELDKLGKLPASYMAVPPISANDNVWTDVVRMRTLNSDQKRRNLEKHICPLQLDVCERSIEMYSNKGDTILDPFAGIMTVPYQAVKMGREGLGIELNADYWRDGVRHLQGAEFELNRMQLVN